MSSIISELENEQMERDLPELRATFERAEYSLNLEMDQRVFALMLARIARLPDSQRIRPIVDTRRLLEIAPVRQYQLTQKTHDLIELKLVTERPLSGIEEHNLNEYLNGQFRHRFDYRYAYCDEIPRSPAGKYEVFRSEVTDDRAR